MKEIKYRVPVQCQNGHKAFWYCQIEDLDFESLQLGVPLDQKCDCPKLSKGQGYTRAGENQLCAPLKDKNGSDIYDGDIAKSVYGVGVVIYGKRGFLFDFGLDSDELWGMAVGREGQRFEIIGSTHLNPELLGST